MVQCVFCKKDLPGVKLEIPIPWYCDEHAPPRNWGKENKLDVMFAIKGDKVKMTLETMKNGDEFDKKKIKDLELNKEYTVEEVTIQGWSSSIKIEGKLGEFNSVNFDRILGGN